MSASEYKTVYAEIPVSCYSVPGKNDHIYEIILEAAGTACPESGKMQLRLRGSETESFFIPVNEPGTYIYKVYEKQGSDNNITYDTRVYTVKLCAVNSGENGLSCSVIAFSEDKMEKQDKLEFSDRIVTCTSYETSAPDESSHIAKNDIKLMYTGDNTMFLMPAALFCASGMMVISLLCIKRRKVKKGDEQYGKK